MIVGAVIGALSGVIGLLFTGDAALAALIQPALIVLAVAQPVCGVVFVLDGVLIGAGRREVPRDRRRAQPRAVRARARAARGAAASAGAAGLAWLAVAFFGVYMLARLATLGWRVRGAAWMTAGA